MTFRWPWLLPALVIVPIAVAVYVWLERRRRKYAVRFASLSLLRGVVPKHRRLRRHVPFVLLLLSVAALLVAMARPDMALPVPKSETSIMLVLDVSRSMCSTDVTPNRLAAAEKAAKSLIQHQSAVRIGIVAFSGAAQILVPPTTDTKKLTDAISGLTTGGGTAIGSGILAAIDALSKVNPDIAPSTVNLKGQADATPNATTKFAPDFVVLLTDGANNRGVDPTVAAQQAADRKLRVYTIGFGTDNPGSLVCTRDQLGGDPFGAFGGIGGAGGAGGAPGTGGSNNASRFGAADQQALENIAKATGATAYRASSAGQLLNVFEQLPSRVKVQTEHREVSVLFVGVGALLALLALGLSLRFNRVL